MPPRHVAIGSTSWGMELDHHRAEKARLRAAKSAAMEAHRAAMVAARAAVAGERARLTAKIAKLQATIREATKKKRARLEAQIKALVLEARTKIAAKKRELLARARADQRAEAAARRAAKARIPREHAEALAAEKARHAEAAAEFRREWRRRQGARDVENHAKKRGKYSENAALYEHRRRQRRLELLARHPERLSWADKWGQVASNIDGAIANGDAPEALALRWRRYRHKKPKAWNALSAERIYERQLEWAAENAEHLAAELVEGAENTEKGRARIESSFLAHYEAYIAAIYVERDQCRAESGERCDTDAARHHDDADAAARECEHAEDPIGCFDDRMIPPF